MPICGSTCNIGGVSGHKFVIELGTNEIDVRAFGDEEFGSYITCADFATVVVDSYERPDVDIGDSVTVSADVGDENFSIPTIVTNQTTNVDAKQVVQFTTNLRVVDDITIS